VYRLLTKTVGIRFDPDQKSEGANLTIHEISSTRAWETGY